MSDEFCPNPFIGLDPLRFRKKEADGVESLEGDEGRSLFLREVERLAKKPEKKRDGSFILLSEQCPMLKKKTEKKKPSWAEKTEEGTTKESLDSACQTMEQALGGELEKKDLAAFLKAVDGVEPLKERGREVQPEKSFEPVLNLVEASPLITGKIEFQLLCRDEYLEGHIAGLDQLTVDKLARGALSPEAHLDLHGFTTVQAFAALRDFVRSSWYKGLRTLLVIPGRGRNSVDGFGILRSKLQTWLTQEPLKRVVLAFCTAQPHDGGPGSVYVLLRKYRKKGRVFWERLPLDEDLY